jgi:hypothetical protein
MVSESTKHDLELAATAPGFKSEADVVRYALDQVLPSLIDRAAQRYAGRTRVLVDTSEPDPYRIDRKPRVATEREPARLRDDLPEAPPAFAYLKDVLRAEAVKVIDTLGPKLEERLQWREAEPKTLAGVAESLDRMTRELPSSPELQPFIDAINRSAAEIAAVTDTPMTRDQELGYVVPGDPFAQPTGSAPDVGPTA